MKWMLIAAVVSSPLLASPIQDCKVNARATATPGFLSIETEGGKCEGDLSEKGGLYMGVFKSRLEDYDTGMGLRNQHMKERFETKKYPYLELRFKGEKDDGELDAVLKIKNEERPVKVKYALSKEGRVNASFSFNIKDFKSVPDLKHAGVGIDGPINIDLEFKK